MMSAQTGGRKVVSVGNYKFTGKRLGKGNFAIVEEAVHSILNIKVAVKIMDINDIKEEYVIRNLYREAKILSKLSHPSIATLFQTMQHGNMYYLVMEVVGGGDLCNFIRAQRNGRLEEHCTRLFARQLISAISHMHNLGIVHRDLKMENVMLSSSNDRIKIVDFGLSNVYSGDRLLRTHCGSPEYAAPELFVEGKPYGPEVDLWSLGVILYGMAVGQLPFVSGSRDGVAATQRREKLIEQINKGLSTPHRKALALFSTDFKSMMGKLLVADSSKRINITELIFHPWLTEKGRRAIRSNPLKKLDDRFKFDIIRDVATAGDVPWQSVQRALHVEPQGNIAGMYNLLAHRVQRSNLDAEILLSKASPSSSRPTAGRSVAESAKCAKSKYQPARRQDTARSTPAQKPVALSSRKPENVKPSTTKGGNLPRCYGDVAPRKSITAKRTIMANDNSSRIRKDSGTGDPQCYNNSVQRLPVQEHADVNICQTPLSALQPVGRSVSSRQDDGIVAKPPLASHNRTNHMRSPAGDAARDNNQCIFNAFMLNSGPAQNTRSKKSKMESMVQQAYASPRLNTTLSATTNPTENRMPYVTKSRNRPLTTAIPSPIPLRPGKRRSMLPVLQMNKTAASATTASRRSTLPKARLHQVTKSATIQRAEEFKRFSNGGVNHKIDLSNEPIARSIAGYMTRNINKSKEESVKWTKGASTNSGA